MMLQGSIVPTLSSIERAWRHPGIAGAENAVAPEIDAELLLERLPDIDFSDDPEAGLLQGFGRALNGLVEAAVERLGEVVAHRSARSGKTASARDGLAVG
uniref:hypothetical protein n=1 Tax=Inquilinus sp. OTU3971 TaxID=3043855 RepID=UPI00313C0063